MKRTKRIISLLLALVLLLATAPLQAFADDEEPYFKENADAGAVNRWCEWQYTAETRTLYINHEGLLAAPLPAAMYQFEQEKAAGLRPENATFDYETDYDGPAGTDQYTWDYVIPLLLEDNETYWNIAHYVRHLIIGKDVTVIDNAGVGDFLSDFNDLRTITFEEGSQCKEIRSGAFSQMYGATITLPDGLERIGDNAFNANVHVDEFIVPDTVYSIGYQAFAGVEAKYFRLPHYHGKHETTFSEGVFRDARIGTLDWGEGFFNDMIPAATFEGAEFTSEDEEPVEFTVPDGIVTIGDNAFHDAKNLIGINLPTTVETIGKQAFAGTGLTSLTLPATGKALRIGERAFADNPIAGITFPRDTATQISLGDNAFANNTDLKSVVLQPSVRALGTSVFSECAGLTSLRFVTAQTTDGIIGVQSVGSDLLAGTAVTNLALPATLNEIPAYLCKDHDMAATLDFSATQIEKVGDGAFMNCATLKRIILPDTVKEIGAEAFSGSGLEEFTAPSQLTSIGDKAFYNTKLTAFTAPSKLSTLGVNVFKSCAMMETADLSASKLTELPANTFSACANLTDVRLPFTLTDVGGGAFQDCVNLDASFALPDSVTRIGMAAFYKTNITSFHFPRSLKTIGTQAFAGTRLQTVDLSETAVTSIGGSAFATCAQLKKVKWPQTLVSIGDYAFYKCQLSELVLSNVVTIDPYAFRDNTRLTKVVLPDSCEYIGARVFDGCRNITYLRLPAGVGISQEEIDEAEANGNTVAEKLRKYAFCVYNVQTVIIPTADISKKTLSNAFYYIPNKDTATIYGVEGSGAQEYAAAHNLPFKLIGELPQTEKATEGTCSGGTWYIERGADGNKLTIAVNGAMANDTFTDSNGNVLTAAAVVAQNAIDTVVFAEGITSIPANLFYTNDYLLSNLKKIDFPDSLLTIGNNAFRGLEGLETVDIPSFTLEIGAYAFADCVNLHAEIGFGSSLRVLREGVFWHTASADMALPFSLEKMEKKALGAYTGSEAVAVVVPSGCTEIYYDARHPEDSAFGFTADGVRDSRITMSTPYQTAAYLWAQEIGFPCDFGGENIHGYWSPRYGNYTDEEREQCLWEYDAETDTVTITAAGYGRFDSELYYFNGERVMKRQVAATNLKFGKGVVYIHGKGKDSYVSVFNPTYVYFNDKIERIRDGAFANCTNLKAIEIPDSVVNFDDDGNPIFLNCTSLASIKIGKKCTAIPANFMKDSKSLKYLEIGESVRTIYDNAFKNCTYLTEIVIPDRVTHIGDYAFKNCFSVQRVVIGNWCTGFGKEALDGLALCNEVVLRSQEYDFSVGGKRYGGKILNGVGSATTGVHLTLSTGTVKLSRIPLDNITKITLTKNVGAIENLDYLTALQEWEVTEDNETFSAHNGCLYSKDGATLVRVPACKTTVDIREGTEIIGPSAFVNSKAKVVTIPEGVTEIGRGAFWRNANLKRIYFPNTLETIDVGAFFMCNSLRAVTFPSSLKTIGGNAFGFCKNLSTVILNEGLETIAWDAFSDNPQLVSVVIPRSVQLVDYGAFGECSALQDVYIWETTVEQDAFWRTEATIHTLADPNSTVSDAYVYAKYNGMNVEAYTDEDVFYDVCEMARDINLGYLGLCIDGHGDIEWLTVYSSDCENDGYKIGVCEYCSEILAEQHLDACGHRYQKTLNIPATATARGVTVYTCENCGDRYCDYYEATGAETVTTQTVSGRVMIASSKSADAGRNPAQGAAVLLDGVAIARTDETGYFSVALETGIYEAVIHYTFGFDRTVYFRVENEDLDAGSLYIIGCDFNRDGVLNDLDDNLFRLSMASTPNDPAYLSYVDMNNDGVINAKDYAILRACMGIDSATFRYEDTVIQK